MCAGPALTVTNDRVYFVGGTSGSQLWSSTGTATETAKIWQDTTAAGWPSWPNITVGDMLYFNASDGTLWTTDGTVDGTVTCAQEWGGIDASDLKEFTLAGDRMYFTADDGTPGFDLYKIDLDEGGNPTNAPPVKLTDWTGWTDPPEAPCSLTFVPGANTLYLATWAEGTGYSLWKTNTSTGLPEQVRELPSLWSDDIGEVWPTSFTAAGNSLFFVAPALAPELATDNPNATFGMQLWKSNGTAEGTKMVERVCPAMGMEGDDLVIMGTSGTDHITINYGGSPGDVEVMIGDDVWGSWGTYTVLGQVKVFGFEGSDTLTLSGTGLGGVKIDGGVGDDEYTVNFGNLAGLVTISDSGTSAIDTLLVNGTINDDHIDKVDGQAVWTYAGSSETVLFSGIDSSTYDLRDGHDVMNDPGGNTTILGGPGQDLIIITATSAGGVVVDGGDDDDDAVIVVSGAIEGAVTVTDSGTMAGEMNSLEIQDVPATGGDPVTTTLVAWGTVTGDNIPVTTIAVKDADQAGTTNVEVLSTSTEGVTLTTSGGSNNFVIDMGNLAGAVAINATGGTNEVTINAPPSESGVTNTLTLSESGLTGGGEIINLNLGSTLTELAVDGSAGNNQLVVEGEVPEQLTLENVVVDTVTTITSSPVSSILHAPVTFTAVVSAAIAAAGTPTGDVQFLVDGEAFGLAPLTNGSAIFTTTALPVGSHTVTAHYVGGTGFLQSTSGPLQNNVAYAFGGFLQPINGNMALGLNRTIPIKFQLSDFAGAFIGSLNSVTSLQVLNSAGLNVLTNAGSTALRYDSAANQFIANWQTKGLSAEEYVLELKLNDGTTTSRILKLSAQGSAKLTADSASATAGGATAGALLGGDVALFIDNQGGQFDADELARVEDAVAAIGQVVAPYGVTIYQVDAASVASANVILEISTTSVAGGFAEGVLGCTEDGGEITLIEGWNWYTGAETGQIGLDQYDFETIVLHEVGHALGLGHSAVSSSVMFATLASGATRRALTVQDLNVADTSSGVSALRAIPTQAMADYAAVTPWTSRIGVETDQALATIAEFRSRAVRLASEGPGPVGALRESLDSRAVGAVLESAYTTDKRPTTSLPLRRAAGREDGAAWEDRAANGLSEKEAVDLVLKEIEAGWMMMMID